MNNKISLGYGSEYKYDWGSFENRGGYNASTKGHMKDLGFFANAGYKINDNQLNILLGIGGSGDTKRIPSKIFINFMELVSKDYDCKFFLATGKNEEEQKILNEVLNTSFKEKCFQLDDLKLNEIIPIITSITNAMYAFLFELKANIAKTIHNTP